MYNCDNDKYDDNENSDTSEVNDDCEEYNEYEGYIYRYTNRNMPEEGWMQSCFKCYQYTSNTVYFKQIKNRGEDFAIYIYVCRKCMNKINKSERLQNLLIRKCDRYIRCDPGFTCRLNRILLNHGQ